MKRSVRLVVAGLISIVGVFAVATTANAAGFFVGNEEGNASIGKSQVVDGTAFMAGSQVTVDGTVKGDLICAGEKVTISGTVEGDVICAGATVTVNGTVNGDVRVAGADVSLGSDVSGSVTAGGSQLTTTNEFKVGRDFTAGGETLSLSGLFGRDVHVSATSLTLRGSVERDFSADVETFTVEQGALVAGSTWYKSPQRLADNGAFQGKVHHEEGSTRDESSTDIGGLLIGLLMLVVLAIVGVLLMPRFVHVASSLPVRDVLLAFLVGFVGILLTPLVGIILASTVVGLLVAFVLLLVWLLAITASGIFASYYVGTLVLQKRATNAILVALAGSAVLGILLLVPFVNVLVFILMVCVGVGMQIMHLKYQFSKDPYKITA